MPDVHPSKTRTISIDAPPERVAAFASNPENLPRWATAFVRSVRRSGDAWIAETPVGPLGIRFVAPNAFGVLDHVVRLPDGSESLSSMRVIPNGAGSEVLFTLFQRPGMTDAQFAEDVGMVERDLRTLKGVMEA
jgi:hypothetical protein